MRPNFAKLIYTATIVIIAGAVSAFGPVDAKKGTYKIDPHHTQIIFEIQHMGLSNFFGRFSKVSGQLVFDPAAPESSAACSFIRAAAVSGASLPSTSISAHRASVTSCRRGSRCSPLR